MSPVHRDVGRTMHAVLVILVILVVSALGNSNYRRKRVAGYITLPFLLGAAAIFNFSRGGGIGRIPGWLLLGACAASVIGIR